MLHNVGGRLSRSGGFTVDRSSRGVIGPPGASEDFGARVRGGDWSGNGVDDLAISVPNFSVSAGSTAGAMQVFYSTGSALGSNDVLFTANSLGGTSVDAGVLGGRDW